MAALASIHCEYHREHSWRGSWQARGKGVRIDYRIKSDNPSTGSGHHAWLTVAYTLTIFDVEHSETENRFVDIGLSASGRVLVVVYTEHGARIRIISCRKATPAERRQYERGVI